jgi:hypothetical protein
VKVGERDATYLGQTWAVRRVAAMQRCIAAMQPEWRAEALLFL